MRTLILATSALACTPVASGDVIGFNARLVSNTVQPVTGLSPLSDPVAGGIWASEPGWYTIDLFVIGDTVGEVINGVNLGGDGSTHGIPVVAGTLFNHPLGGNTRSFALEPHFSAIFFDTYACFGGTNTMDGSPTHFAGNVNLTGAGGWIRFTSFTTPPVALTPGTFGSHAAEVRVLRFTISHGASIGVGTGEIGLAGGGLLVAHIVIPTPGAGASGLVVGAMGLRRRLRSH